MNTIRAILYGTMLRLRREGKDHRYSAIQIRNQVNSFSTKFKFSKQEIEEALEDLRLSYPLTLDYENHRLGWRLERRQRHNKYNK